MALNSYHTDFPGRLDEAFSHCVAVWKTKAFKDSFEWVACCVEIFEVCHLVRCGLLSMF